MQADVVNFFIGNIASQFMQSKERINRKGKAWIFKFQSLKLQ